MNRTVMAYTDVANKIMKKTIMFITFILTTNCVFGQKRNTTMYTATNNIQKLTRQGHIDNNLTKVSAYSYTINIKGRVKKDSLLLYKQQLDITQNKLWGLMSAIVYQSHGPSSLAWYEFETYYNDSGQVIKEISKPKDIEKSVEYGSNIYDIITEETDYEYDEMQRVVKQTYKVIDHKYSISKNTKDTFHLHIIDRPRIDEYLYNSDNQKIKWYQTIDSTKYLRTQSYNPDKDPNAVKCSSCHSRYLIMEWKYNNDKKMVESISYTYDNLIHTKQNYYYDDQQRLIKQIDSMGWYITTIKPFWKSTTTFQYTDSGRIVTTTNNPHEHFVSPMPKIVSYFDKREKLIKQCTFSDNSKWCTQYFYSYNKNKLIKIAVISDNETNSSTELYYNNLGLIKEERTLINGNLTTLIRYYYE